MCLYVRMRGVSLCVCVCVCMYLCVYICIRILTNMHHGLCDLLIFSINDLQ